MHALCHRCQHHSSNNSESRNGKVCLHSKSDLIDNLQELLCLDRSKRRGHMHGTHENHEGRSLLLLRIATTSQLWGHLTATVRNMVLQAPRWPATGHRFPPESQTLTILSGVLGNLDSSLHTPTCPVECLTQFSILSCLACAINSFAVNDKTAVGAGCFGDAAL